MPKKKIDPKVESLKKFGTYNARAGNVSDHFFGSHEFFDARDLVQVKYEMLRRVSEDGWTISQAAEAFGFSRPSFYEAQSEFNHAGLAGLMPEKRGPKEAHKISGEVISFIERIRAENDEIRTTEVIQKIKEKFGIDVHRRSIERALTRSKKKL